MIIEDDDAEGLVGWGFIKILRGQFWDDEIRSKAQEVARWMTDNVSTHEEKTVIRAAGLSGYEQS
jgi:hypothetical protein